jgi:hypothetical protein
MKRTRLLPVILLLFWQACVSLDQVHTFSTNAVGILASVNDLDYSFKSSYLRYTLPGKEFTIKLKDPEVDTAALHLSTQADATISLFTGTLSGYFGALGRLSDGATGKTDYSKLGEALKGNKPVMAKMHLTAEHVEAGISLSRSITNALTKHYKESRIRAVILADTAAVRITVDALCIALAELQNNNVSDQGQLKAKYLLLMKDPEVDKGAKIVFAREYQKEAGDLEQKRQAIESQKRGVRTIGIGHRDIADKLKENKLSLAEIQDLIDEYSAELHTIYDDIKKLSK